MSMPFFHTQGRSIHTRSLSRVLGDTLPSSTRVDGKGLLPTPR